LAITSIDKLTTSWFTHPNVLSLQRRRLCEARTDILIAYDVIGWVYTRVDVYMGH